MVHKVGAHAIIEDGGDSPNVIPRHASLNLYVRSGEVETLLDLSRRVDDIMHGAALMSGCGTHSGAAALRAPVPVEEALLAVSSASNQSTFSLPRSP